METLTIRLPDDLYQRVKLTANTLSISLETVIAEVVDLGLPAFESDLPPDVQIDLAALALLNDAQLWKIAHHTMEQQQQKRLEAFAELQKHRELQPNEQAALTQLMTEAQQIMLRKAEACRLLAQRGHIIFAKNSVDEYGDFR